MLTSWWYNVYHVSHLSLTFYHVIICQSALKTESKGWLECHWVCGYLLINQRTGCVKIFLPPLRTMKVCTKFHGKPSNTGWDISVKKKCPSQYPRAQGDSSSLPVLCNQQSKTKYHIYSSMKLMIQQVFIFERQESVTVNKWISCSVVSAFDISGTPVI